MLIDLSRIVTAKAKAAQAAQASLRDEMMEAETVLAASDWRVIRAAETGSELSEADRGARQALRDRISALREKLAAYAPDAGQQAP